jgi:S1-C subfamily serine protease
MLIAAPPLPSSIKDTHKPDQAVLSVSLAPVIGALVACSCVILAGVALLAGRQGINPQSQLNTTPNPQSRESRVGVSDVPAAQLSDTVRTPLDDAKHAPNSAISQREKEEPARGPSNFDADVLPTTRDSPPASTVSLADLIDEIEKSVVQITARGAKDISMGSGFIAGREGIVITNYHVVDGATQAEVQLKDRTRYEVRGVLWLDDTRDIAVLQIDPGKHSLSPLAMRGTLPRKGETVYAFGSPLGLSFSASDGIVSGIRDGNELAELFKRFGDDSAHYSGTWLQTTAPISKGNSGGPLVNSSGEVVALSTLTSRYLGGENINFAIASVDLVEAVAKSEGRRPKAFTEAFPPKSTTVRTPTYMTPLPAVEADRSVGVVAIVAGGNSSTEELAIQSRIGGHLTKMGYEVNRDSRSAGRVVLCALSYAPAGTYTVYRCDIAFIQKPRTVNEKASTLWSSSFTGQFPSSKLNDARRIDLLLDNYITRNLGARFK